MERCPACMLPVEDGTHCPSCGCALNRTNPPEYLAVGSLLNQRYTVGTLLQKQAVSNVYIGYDSVTMERVLLRVCTGDIFLPKENNSEKHSSPTLLEHFMQFHRALAEVNLCSVLPRLIDVFEQDGMAIAVHAYFEGISLRELLHSNTAISKQQALQLGKEISVALKALHTAGIVFGTLSPENIFILKNGEVRLYGLGLSVYSDIQGLEERAGCINPSYAAPELFYGPEEEIASAVDSYSLAAVLYRLLCEKIPPVSFYRNQGDTLENPRRLNSALTKTESNALLNGLNWQIRLRTANPTAVLKQFLAEHTARRANYLTFLACFLGKLEFVKQKIAENSKEKVQSPKAKNSKKIFLAVFSSVLVILLLVGVFAILLLRDRKQPEKASSMVENVISGTVTEREESKIGTGFHDISSTEPVSSNKTSSKESSVFEETDVAICPDLTGKTLYEAEQILLQLGLNLGKVTYKSSETVEEGLILTQSVKKDRRVVLGKSISVTVSSGSENIVKMPQLVGLNLNEAVNILTKNGIAYMVQYHTNTAEPGTVLEQSVAVDEKVTGSVILTVSGQRVTVPDYTGKTVAEAVADENLTVSAVKNVNGEVLSMDAVLEKKIISQSLVSGSTTYKGNTVELTVEE